MKALAGLSAGGAILCVAIYWLRLGRVWDNIYGWSSKEERPLWFWLELMSVFLIAGLLIAYSLMDLLSFRHL
jgi:hypothetical protein